MNRPLVVWDPRMLGYDLGGKHPMHPLRWELTWLLAGTLGVIDGQTGEVTEPAPRCTYLARPREALPSSNHHLHTCATIGLRTIDAATDQTSITEQDWRNRRCEGEGAGQGTDPIRFRDRHAGRRPATLIASLQICAIANGGSPCRHRCTS